MKNTKIKTLKELKSALKKAQHVKEANEIFKNTHKRVLKAQMKAVFGASAYDSDIAECKMFRMLIKNFAETHSLLKEYLEWYAIQIMQMPLHIDRNSFVKKLMKEIQEFGEAETHLLLKEYLEWYSIQIMQMPLYIDRNRFVKKLMKEIQEFGE